MWTLFLYLPQNQKTFKSFFSFRDLRKINRLLKEKNEDENLLGVSGFQNLDQTIEKTAAKN
jgi:hypothetical protein